MATTSVSPSRIATGLLVLGLLLTGWPAIASAQTNPPNPLNIVSLGDSYIAGNGAGNYVPGQGPGQPDTSSLRVPGTGANCFHSFSSYPMQYGDQLAAAGFPTTVHQGACSGAQTGELVPQWNVVPPAVRAEADIILISAGGNDAGFTTVVSACLFSIGNCSGALAAAAAAIVPARDRLETAIGTILAEVPNARIVVVGYPFLASPANGSILCLFAQQQSTLTAIQQSHETELADMVLDINTGLSSDRVELALPSQRFLNRGPCAVSNRLLHNLTTTEGESFHPNLAGHAEYADLLFDADFHFDLPEPAMCAGRVVTVDLSFGQAPSDGNDVILGTPAPDTIDGGAGNDTVCGGGGDDVIHGGAGNDTLYGGPGNDELTGGDGIDRLFGQSDNDTLRGEAGDDRVYGGPGDDAVFGDAGNDRLYGQSGQDNLNGGSGSDLMYGGVDDDQLHGGDGPDWAYGQGGDDTMTGGNEIDFLYGNVGDDTISGDAGQDRLFGVGGNDVINGGPDGDYVYGGGGNDTLRGDGGDDLLYGQAGNDDLFGNAGADDLCHRGAGATDTADNSCETVV